MSFVFRSYLTNGQLDLSWSLGDVAITNGTTTSGTATITTAIPPGMVQPNQAVDVFALYGGDTSHLPSFSAAQHIMLDMSPAPSRHGFRRVPSRTGTTGPAVQSV